MTLAAPTPVWTEDQLAAISAPPTGILRLTAGAGAGKTEVLTRRIAALAGGPVPPTALVAITYTNKAATELRLRLRRRHLLPESSLRQLTVATFHGFLLDRLRRDPFSAGIDRGTRILSQNARDLIARTVLDRFVDHHVDVLLDGPEALGSAAAERYLAAFPSLLGQIRRHLLDPRAADERVTGRFDRDGEPTDSISRRIWSWFHRYLTCYLTELDRLGALDFDGILIEGRRLLGGRVTAGTAAERCFLIDEFQDNNPEQLDIVRQCLRDETTHLTVVGDPAQSIYRFQGAEVRTFTRLAADRDISLLANFRSYAEIVALADAIIAPHLPQCRVSEARRGPSPRPQPIAVLTVDTEGGDPSLLEGATVATMISELIARGVRSLRHDRALRFSDVAVLVPSLKTIGKAFEDELIRRQIPYQMSGGIGFYDRSEIQEVIACLRLLETPTDDAALLQLLSGPLFGMTDSALARLAAGRREEGDSLLGRLLAPAEATLPPPARRFRRRYLRLCAERHRSSLLELTHRLLDLMGFRAYAASLGNPLRRRRIENNLDKFVAMVRHFESHELFIGLRDFLQYVDATLGAGIDEEEAGFGDDPLRGDAVRIMTIHKAKGLEFPVVFLPFLRPRQPGQPRTPFWYDRESGLVVTCGEDGRRRDDPRVTAHLAQEAALDGEEGWRRWYVALTRAEELLVLSGPAPSDRTARSATVVDPLAASIAQVQQHPDWGTIGPATDWPAVCGRWGRPPASEVPGTGATPSAAAPTDPEATDDLDAAIHPAPTTSHPPPGSDEPPTHGNDGDPLATRLMTATDTLARVRSAWRPLGEPAPFLAPTTFSLADLITYERCPRSYHWRALRVTPFGRPTGPRRMELGQLVHQILRLYHEHPVASWSAGDRERCMSQLLAEVVPLVDPTTELAPIAWPILRAWLAHPWSAVDATLVEAEVNLRLGREPLTFFLRGFADRIDRQGDGIRVIDYKLGRFTPERHQRYARQIALYAVAADRGLFAGPRPGGQAALPFTACSIVYLTAAGADERPIEPDRPTLEEWACQIVARIRADTEWQPRRGPRCGECGWAVLCQVPSTPAPTLADDGGDDDLDIGHDPAW